MAKTYSVRNTAPGTRGFYDAKTGYTELDAGATATDVTFSDAELASVKTIAGLELFEGEAPADDDAGDGDTPAGAKAYGDITAADLKKHLTDAGVAFESDANKKALYEQYAATFAPPAPPPVTEPTDELDKMADADLRDTVKALTGEEPPADADRETLLKLARGEG